MIRPAMIREVLTLERLRSMGPDDAAALLAIRRSDSGLAVDEPTLDAWLRLDEANVRAWARAQKAWSSFDEADDDEILSAMRLSARQARATGLSWAPSLAAAAVILVLISGGLYTLFQVNPFAGRSGPVVAASHPAPRAVWVTYATVKGQRSVFSLPDGSKLTLDTDSAVETDFTTARRDLHLVKGQAFFDVKHDAARPFSVHAAGGEIVAVGTRFDVRLDPGSMRVVLIEGTVSVKSRNPTAAPTVLHAGQQLVDRPGAAPVVSAANVDEVLNWQRGFVSFDNDTLATAAAELNRYSRDQIIVADPRIASLRVSGVFQAGDPLRFGRTLAQIHPVQMKRSGPDQLEIVAAQ